MNVHIRFLGAAGTVTGSKYLVEHALRHRIETELRWPALVPEHGSTWAT